MTKEQTNIEQTAAQRAEEVRKLRGGRKPIDGSGSRFPDLPRRPGFKTHWHNDVGNNIVQKLKEGWTFSERPGFTDSKVDLVKNPTKRIQERVDRHDNYEDMLAFAMDLPQEIYDEDRIAKLKSVDRKEAFMQTGKTVADDGGMGFKVDATIKTNQSNFKPD